MLILSNPPHPLLTPSPPHRLTLSAAQRLVEVPAPTDEQLLAMLHRIIGRLMKLLTRRGVLIEEQGSTYMADSDAESDDAQMLRPLQAAA